MDQPRTTTRGRLTVRAGAFERDGRPHRVVSGALHYFRIHPALWRDRLQRAAALGLNTVETYVPWNWHERQPGRARFDGWRDLTRFVELAGELGLDVIVRPGPYICAEWDFGGLPAWLLREGPARLRCTDPAFLAAVDRWFDHVVPQLVPLQSSRGGPVVAVQVENEYGSFGDDKEYLRFCRDGLLRRGIDVLLVTSDGAGPDYLASGTVEGVLPTVNFGSRAHEALVELHAFDASVPPMVMELWSGWFDHWGQTHHVRAADEVAGLLDDVLTGGASLNLYLAHGGTSFGLWNGANVVEGEYRATVTSYDYGAAIGEAGELTATFHAVRDVIGRHTGVEPPAPPPQPARHAPAQAVVERWGGLLDNLSAFGPAAAVAPMPLTMEELGVDHGLVLYRSQLLVPPGGDELRLEGLADRAVVLADGDVLGVLDRNEPDAALTLGARPDGRATALDVLVENQGRVNYGHDLGERKGVRGVRLGRRFVHGWESVALPLDAEGLVGRLRLAGDGPPQAPALAQATFVVDAPADGFIALPGWGKGFVWLGDFLLGRYWSVGPQRTLYAPAPLWRSGTNVVTVLELHEPGRAVELREEPDLGPTATT